MKMVKSTAIVLVVLLLATMFVGCTAATTPSITVENTSQTATVSSEAELTYRSEELIVTVGDKSIYGTLFVPKDAAGKLPTVILSHGYNGTGEQGEKIAAELAVKGYITYSFDFCGGSAKSRSSGKTTEMSVLTEVADLNDVIDELMGNSLVDTKNLFLFGGSQGGAVAALAAASRPDDIAGLVVHFPAFVIRDDMHEAYASLDEIGATVKFMGLEIGHKYYEDMWDYDVYEHIGNYKKDVLIFHGDKDTLVPLSYSERAVEVYESAHLEVFPGQGHGFGQPYSGIALEMTLEYLEEHIQ